jgi:hypothetical protein
MPPLFNLASWYLGKCQFYHSTAFYIIPPNIDVTLKWAPAEDDVVQVIFAVTFGEPRDYNTGEVVWTDEVGFWHRGRGMKWHWDPLVPSIIRTVYPHVTPTTKQDFFEVRFVNRTNRVIIVDVSLWIFEYTESSFKEFLEMVEGFAKLFRLFSKLEVAGPAPAVPAGLGEAVRAVATAATGGSKGAG